MDLSIVIPARNEEHRLEQPLREYAAALFERFGDAWELIVVVNHSSDNTEGIARAVAETHPQIRVVAEPERIGKGGAVEQGMGMAQGDLVGFVDADGATSASSFLDLFDHIGDAGCIIGSRWIEGAVVNPKQPWMRRLASRVLNRVVVRGLFRLDVHDSQCGAKLFRREVLDRVLPGTIEPGWAFDIELLCRIQRAGFTIREHPIEWHHVPGNPTTFLLMSLQMMASVRRVKRALAQG